MQLSETNRKILESRKASAGPELSDTNRAILDKRQEQARIDSLPMPELPGASPYSTYDGSQGPATGMDLFIGNLPKTIVQGTARGAAVVPSAVGSLFGADTDDAKLPTDFWWSKAVFGEGDLSLNTEVRDPLVAAGASEESAVAASAPLAILFASLDVLPGGKPVKMGILSFLETVAKTTDPKVIETEMKALGFSDDSIVKWGGEFQAAKTTDEVEAIFKAAGQDEKNIKLVENTSLKTVDDSNPITIAGKSYDEVVTSVKTRVQKIFDDLNIPSNISKTPNFSLKTLDSDMAVLAKADVDITDLADDIADIRATMRAEPERFSYDVPKTGAVPVTDGPFRIRDGEVPVQSLDEVSEVVIKDGRFEKTGDVPVTQLRQEGRLDITDGTYKKQGDVFVKGTKGGKAGDVPVDSFTIKNGEVTVSATKNGIKDVPIERGPRYSMDADDVTVPAYKAGDEAPTPKKQPVAPKKQLDEVANPTKDNMGMLSYSVQARYGKAAVTKGKLEKFKAAEDKVFFEILRYLEELAYVAEKGGDMVQSIPAWVPQNLASPIVFKNVTDMLQRGVLPTSHGSKEMALYTEMVDEVARRVGIIKKGPKPSIDPVGAVLEATERNTRKPGSVATPLVKSEPTTGAKVESKNAALYTKEYESPDDIQAAYAEFAKEKTAPKKGRKPAKADSKPYGIDLSKLKDTSKFKSVFRDMYRNAEKVFGEQWPIIKKNIFDPFDAAKGRMVDEEKKLTDWLQTKIVKELGIKKGSKLSRAVMDFGEKIDGYNYDALLKDVGTKEKADRVVEAARLMRVEYDRMITEVNAVEMKIYPNNPEKWTPNRKDYFRHYEEMSIGFTNMFEDPRLSNLPSTIRPDESRGALTHWQSFTQERLGWKSRRDAVGGFLNYVPQFAYTKHIDPETARMREFIKELEAGTATSQNLGNFIEGIRKWVDDLAGQANFADRFAEYAPGGRWTLDKMDFLNKRAKRNAILGNFGASISQIFNVPGAIATAGAWNSTRAVLRTMGEIAHAVDVRPGWEQGTFIKERYRNSMYDKFDTKIIDQPMKMASWLLGVLDEVGTKFAWNAHYEKAIREAKPGVNPVLYADEMTRKAVAGRGIGEVPVLQKSKVFQTIAPFQLEVMNQWWLMGDMMSEKQFGQMATLFASYFVFNHISEEIKGSSVGFDPVQAFYDSYKIYEDELVETDDKVKQITGRLSGEVLGNLPMGSYAVAGISGAMGMTEEQRKDFFGEADPVRFGNSPLVWNAIKDPLYGILPTWGGAQLKKTFGGVTALAEGEVRGKDGDVLYDVPVEPGVQGAMQNILFGPYSTNFAYKDEVEKEMTALYKENTRLVEAGEIEQVKETLDSLPEDLKPRYIQAAKDEKKRERQIEVKNMVPTYLMATALVKEGKTDEAKTILDGLDEEQRELYIEAAKSWNAPADEPMSNEKDVSKPFADRLPLLMRRRDTDSQEVSADADEWMIQTALDYAYAFGTNPQQAFEIVFMNNDVIRDTVRGGDTVVRTERMPFKSGDIQPGSDPVKRKLMKEEGLSTGKSTAGMYYLEHNVPLGLGGSNEIDNLFISTAAEHDAWTEVENFLIDAFKDGKIGYKEAQELIVRHRGRGDVEPISFEEIKVIIDKK